MDNIDCIAIYSRKSKFTGKGESIGNVTLCSGGGGTPAMSYCGSFARHEPDLLAQAIMEPIVSARCASTAAHRQPQAVPVG